MQKIIIITGPTGVGKSEAAVRLAESLGGEVINADSRQVYREMDIGVSKPSPNLMARARHHGYGVASIAAPWHGGLFEDMAARVINDVSSRGQVPIVVGGTALYVKFLLYGLCGAPETGPETRELFKQRLLNEGSEALHAELSTKDPETHAKVNSRDAVRITRALEVYEETGVPISEWQKQHGFTARRYDFLKIALNLPREHLYARIDRRVDQMLAEGLEDEVTRLFGDWPGNAILAKSIGYAEWIPHFEGLITRADVVAAIQKNTRNFAKRQMTWFRKEGDVIWFEPGQDEAVLERSKDFLER
jgi:tRNA dimethylallyltransferase